MKILLIDPPYNVFTGYATRYFPMGLCSIAAALRDAGHEVGVLHTDTLSRRDDLDFSNEYVRLEAYLEGIGNHSHQVWSKLEGIAQEFRPDLVGITSMTMTFGSAVRTAELSKRLFPDVPVIMGGAHAKDWPAMTLATEAVDYCLGGEAEETVLLFVDMLDAGGSAKDKIPGLGYRAEGQTVLNPAGRPPGNLDAFSDPARDLLLADGYTSEDMGAIMTSRGCAFRCAFCSHERVVRFRSIDGVIGEIRRVMERYGTRQFAFKDDSFSLNRKRTVEFCRRLLQEKLRINWDCTTRVNLLDPELVDLMIDAGCNTVKIGVETGSPRILEAVDKGVTIDQVRRAAELLNDRGLFWSGYFLYGVPQETEEDLEATLQFLEELDPPYAGLGLYAPYPNTKLWDIGVEMDIVDPDVPLEHFFTTNPKDYFFRDPSRRVAGMEPDQFAEVAGRMREIFHKHNTRPKGLLRRAWARRRAYIGDPRLVFSDCRKVVSWLSG
ncbi:MAG: radical SAM protein [Candidatus Eisenbacteria sp.]|nr:radical SAM protein [Candidatus Eisenbacteria bacterium]